MRVRGKFNSHKWASRRLLCLVSFKSSVFHPLLIRIDYQLGASPLQTCGRKKCFPTATFYCLWKNLHFMFYVTLTYIFHSFFDHARCYRCLALTQWESMETIGHPRVLSKLQQCTGRILQVRYWTSQLNIGQIFPFLSPPFNNIKHGQQQTKPVNRQTSRREDNEVRNTRELTQSINDICILISRTDSVQYNHCLRSQSLPGSGSFVTSQMSVLRYQSIGESFNESVYMMYRGYTIKRSWQQTFYVG